MKAKLLFGMLAVLLTLPCCENLDDDPDKYLNEDGTAKLPLDDVAVLLSEIQIGASQVREVYDAVTSSSWNGYDEEYMMRDLFREPGAGVGDDAITAEAAAAKASRMKAAGIRTRAEGDYAVPLRDLIEEHVRERQGTAEALTKAGGLEYTAEEYLELLESSDIQIYWPYSEDWDGRQLPIITFDPDDGSTANVGYQILQNENGETYVAEVVVNEDVAMTQPVWVVNRNDDSSYTSLDLLRMQDPDWGSGGEIVVRPSSASGDSESNPIRLSGNDSDDSDEGKLQTLILKDFTMLRNYDPWFAGASEFFVKIGSVECFTASTEAEMWVYNPSITDFMIVVKRKYLGKALPFNAVLVSEWTEQLESCAFMISEYDGGTRTSWSCSAVVKINSKSYGFEIEIPINTRDDVVWRGQLSRKYIIATNGMVGHFGDVDLTFEIVEYD